MFVGRTPWPERLDAPLRAFLRTEIGGATVLLVATVAALAWTNVDGASYERVWRTRLALAIAGLEARPRDLLGYAEQLGLDIDRFSHELEAHRMRGRVAEDVDGADLSNVAGAPPSSSTATATTARTRSAASPGRSMPLAHARRSPPSRIVARTSRGQLQHPWDPRGAPRTLMPGP